MDGTINFNQLEHLQAKYVGTGHPDTTRREWIETQHRDTNASFIGHPNLTKYLSVSMGECTARVKYNLLEGMLMPLIRQTVEEPIYSPNPNSSTSMNKDTKQPITVDESEEMELE